MDSLNKEQEKATGGHPDKGKLAEFTSAGALIRVFDNDGRLNAPWGVALAPSGLIGAYPRPGFPRPRCPDLPTDRPPAGA